jgi:hypothetical protein
MRRLWERWPKLSEVRLDKEPLSSSGAQRRGRSDRPASQGRTWRDWLRTKLKTCGILEEIGHAYQEREGQSPHSQTGLKLGAI